MNTVIFILGIVTALVVILIAAVVVIMLKMKSIKQVDDRLTQNMDNIHGALHQEILNAQMDAKHAFEEVERKVVDESVRRERTDSENLGYANSYTDKRFDKASNKDVGVLADLIETAKKDGQGKLIISFSK